MASASPASSAATTVRATARWRPTRRSLSLSSTPRAALRARGRGRRGGGIDDDPAIRHRHRGKKGVGAATENGGEHAGGANDDDDASPLPPPNNLILIGGRGCGKSALCRRLVALEPRFELFVLDDIVVEDAGKSIPKIVEEDGWRAFRDLEFDACRKTAIAAGRGWCLIDAGGGVVVDLDEHGNEVYSERKVDALKRNGQGKIVYLKRAVSYLTRRITGDKNRPSLSEKWTFGEIMRRRAPMYERAADYVCDGSGGALEKDVKTKNEIKREVIEWFYDVSGSGVLRAEGESGGEELFGGG